MQNKNDIMLKILNEYNVPITATFINGIFKKLDFDHTVKHIENFQQAMIHVSYLEENLTNPKTIKLLKDVTPIDIVLVPKCMPLQQKSYERLEFLGDSVIRHGIGKYLYLRYPNEDQGFLTANRSKMENKFALAQLARKLGLQKYAVISRNLEQLNGRTTFTNITEDIFEAFIGALNLEIGENKSIKFIWRIIETELDMAETIRTQKNYKDMLMQHYHKHDGSKQSVGACSNGTRKNIAYIDTEIECNGKKRYKTIAIEKETRVQIGCGIGRSKKSSQQHAARDALISIGVLRNTEEQDEYFEYTGDIDDELNKAELLAKNM